MTFAKALAALNKGAVIYIPGREATTRTRISPRGDVQRAFGKGWITRGSIGIAEIMSTDWEVEGTED